MKTAVKIICIGIIVVGMGTHIQAQDGVMAKDQVIAEGEKMADAQLRILKGNYWGRFWIDGVMWAGFADISRVSGKKADYLKEFKKMGERGKWDLIFNKEEPDHADDLCIGQAFLYVYEETKDPKTIEKTIQRLDQASDVILNGAKEKTAVQLKNEEWTKGLTWYWCDALFMAAPVHARLSADTGDPKYLKAMHTEWKRISDLLYDQEEHLFFRDARHLDKQAKNGKKVFWSRGNGWVMGALARILPYIPQDDPLRPSYIKQFKEMATKLASIQRPDGTWSPSLLDYEQFPYSETSGTALNCFAMAWGINNGILDEKNFRPVVEKAWAALLAARQENGLMGYVQGVGAEPGKVYADSYRWDSNGVFLMVAAQMAQMAPLHIYPAPKLTAAAQSPPWAKKKKR